MPSSQLSNGAGKRAGDACPTSTPPPDYAKADEVLCAAEIDRCSAIDKAKVKTMLCHNYMHGHRCPFGTHCAFAHGEAELRPSTVKVELGKWRAPGGAHGAWDDWAAAPPQYGILPGPPPPSYDTVVPPSCPPRAPPQPQAFAPANVPLHPAPHSVQPSQLIYLTPSLPSPGPQSSLPHMMAAEPQQAVAPFVSAVNTQPQSSPRPQGAAPASSAAVIPTSPNSSLRNRATFQASIHESPREVVAGAHGVTVTTLHGDESPLHVHVLHGGNTARRHVSLDSPFQLTQQWASPFAEPTEMSGQHMHLPDTSKSTVFMHGNMERYW